MDAEALVQASGPQAAVGGQSFGWFTASDKSRHWNIISTLALAINDHRLKATLKLTAVQLPNSE